MAKTFKTMEALFSRANNTEKRYEEALERKQEELIQLTAELQEKQFKLKELHKMKLLNEVSEETYKEEAEKVELLQKKVQDVQNEISLIRAYKSEDIQKIIDQLEEERNKAFKNHQDEIQKIRLELLEAKLNYLQKLIQASEKYNALVKPERMLDSLKRKLGLKESYISSSFDTLFVHPVPNGEMENLKVEQKEIFDALTYAKTPESLTKIVRDARENGIIE